jgi:hypothetical protein
MEGFQMLKFNFKKAWLCILAGTAEEQRETIRQKISDSCEFADGHVEMPDENNA